MVRVTHRFWISPYIPVIYAALWCVLCLSLPVWAQVGTTVSSGQTVTVDAHGECRQVTNLNPGTRVVFTGTSAEWQSFRDNPNGLVMESCVTCEKDDWAAKPVLDNGFVVFTVGAVSADRSTMIITGGWEFSNLASITVSNDEGETWASRSTGIRTYFDAALSADGSKGLVAAGYQDYLYVSNDNGTTWVARANKQSSWSSVSMSADGTKMFASGSGGIYRSTNTGVSWEHVRNIEGNGWGVIRTSHDGQTIVAAISQGRIHISTDGGNTWIAQGTIDSVADVAISADGQQMAVVQGEAGIGSKELYTSSNRGATWQKSSLNAAAVAYAADGKLFAIHGTTVYLSQDNGMTWNPYKENFPATWGSYQLYVAPDASWIMALDGIFLEAVCLES